jgi:hypothetical protein
VLPSLRYFLKKGSKLLIFSRGIFAREKALIKSSITSFLDSNAKIVTCSYLFVLLS